MINLRKEHCLCVSNDYWVFTRLQLDQKAKINKYSFSIVLVSFHYYLEKSCGVLLKRDTKTKLKDTKTYTCTENEVFAVAGTRSLSLWPQCNTDEGEAEVAAMKVIINKQNISIWHSLLQTHLHSWSTDIKIGFCQPPPRGTFSLNLFSFWEHPFSLQIWTTSHWASILDLFVEHLGTNLMNIQLVHFDRLQDHPQPALPWLLEHPFPPPLHEPVMMMTVMLCWWWSWWCWW